VVVGEGGGRGVSVVSVGGGVSECWRWR
jgi:hypothetical protein